MSKLRQLKKKYQRARVSKASDEFIQDVSEFMKKLKSRRDLVKNTADQKFLRRHSKKLRKLIDTETPIHKKRRILKQRGGILSALIPIICTCISAGGVTTTATSAANIKS